MLGAGGVEIPEVLQVTLCMGECTHGLTDRREVPVQCVWSFTGESLECGRAMSGSPGHICISFSLP